MNGQSGNVERFPKRRFTSDDPTLNDPVRIFQTFDPSSMMERPEPPRWLVDGVVMTGMTCLFTGIPGVGKSLLLQQLLTAAALGRPWLGYETEPVKCFGMFCEDPQQFLKLRQWDIFEHFNILPPDLENRFIWESGQTAENTMWVVEYGRGRPTLWGETFWRTMGNEGYGLVERQSLQSSQKQRRPSLTDI